MIQPKRKRARAKVFVAGTMMALASLANSPSEPPEGVEFNKQERNKWRVSVGPAFNFNLRSRLGFKSGRAVGVLSQFAAPQASSGSSSRQAALDRITGASDPNGVKRYEGGAWIDPRDSAHDGTATWNFAVPSAADLISDGQMTLRSATYAETKSGSVIAMGAVSSSDDFNAPGVNIEVSRELYFDPKRHYGIDLSLGFSWFMRSNCFDGGGEICRRKDTTTTRTGYFTETYDVGYMRNPKGQYPLHDGILGNGTYDGPGPVLFIPGEFDEIVGSSSSRSSVHSVGAYAYGDYNEFEFTAALRPFYEPWEWLRLYGTLGLGLSYMHLSYRESLTYDGFSVWSARRTEDDFAVYGLVGLGAQLNYKQFLLGFDFYARLWAHDVDFDSELLQGSISRGPWMFRGYVGFEF